MRSVPALTVRQVPGRNPTRVVVGSADGFLESLMCAGNGPIVVVDDHHASTAERVQNITLPRVNGRIEGVSMLAALYQHGLRSVYVEGGAITTSNLLADGCIDVMQLHFSPMILGSGVNAFVGPTASNVAESLRFADHDFRPIGDGMMFIGEVARPEPGGRRV